jgi:hypothetical protein
MRLTRMLLVAALALPMSVLAQDPPVLEPLPEPPPPPPGLEADDPAAEPEVTIIKRGEDTVQEYRINGELYMMKITPAHGVPYYLMKEDQDSGWSRMDGPNPPLVVPKWVLFNF